MQDLLETDVKNIFDFYRSSVFSISNDLHFWKVFLDSTIEKSYKEDTKRKHFESIFSVYDLSHNSPDGLLKTYKEVFEISNQNLDGYKKRFFSWIMNLAVVKIYNSCELLLLRTIQLEYYPSLGNPLESKKNGDKVSNQVKRFLVAVDSRNNRHLVEFLKRKSILFEEFSRQETRLSSDTNWIQFFEFISILRHIIVHQGGIIDKDAFNLIKSVSKKTFEDFFNLQEDKNGYNVLEPKDGDYFLNFVNLINDFSLNTAKFVLGKRDLAFLDMY
ncbi:hypothetical protein [Ferruginibacter sp. SUN106]|uniref:hypothetical protein n=1 Tax=Ferruginibacter sp. SUN106 TaxID=2978348 RepID=UPI003D35CA98